MVEVDESFFVIQRERADCHQMLFKIASHIMARTTLNIETPVLEELKRLQKVERKPLGQLASELLAEALSRRGRGEKAPSFKWRTGEMNPLVDIGDKEAVYAVLDKDRR